MGCVHVRRIDVAHYGESLSRAATQGVEKGVCRFVSIGIFARDGFSIVSTGGGVEIFLFETGDVGTVHLNELEVSEGNA